MIPVRGQGQRLIQVGLDGVELDLGGSSALSGVGQFAEDAGRVAVLVERRVEDVLQLGAGSAVPQRGDRPLPW